VEGGSYAFDEAIIECASQVGDYAGAAIGMASQRFDTRTP
jgi:hypothetical protein